MPPFRNPSSTRRLLQIGLVAAGFVAGAVFGVVLTRLGKIVAGAPPATFDNYVWNAVVFGLMAAVVSPLVTWSGLRRVPLWRTIAEPLVAAIAGGCVAVIVNVPVLILFLPPLGLALGFANLRRRYPDPLNALESGGDASLTAELSETRS